MAARCLCPSQSLVLGDGLRTTLVHTPDDSHAAVLLRVAAGSHDEPRAFPGLAHFLEHLLFLGGRRFVGEQRLMPFVQACGGRLNASTGARSTEFFFELPAARLVEGLARLQDMLLYPALEESIQLREREVLEAEFRARAADLDTLAEAALAWAVADGHPLRDFHAGNRASLAVEQAAFRHALAVFHQRHYRRGACSLVLLGPQPLEELQSLAAQLARSLPAGAPPPRGAPPELLPLRSPSLAMHLAAGLPRLWLGFVLDGQAHLEPAVGLLDWLLGDESPGSLLARLGELGLVDGLRLRLPYQHAGQGLLVLDFSLVDAGAETRALVEAALFDWLGWLLGTADWNVLLADYAAHLRRHLAGLAPLERAREWPRARGPAVEAVRALLAQLQPQRLIRLCGAEELRGAPRLAAGFTVELAEESTQPLPSRRPDWRFGVTARAGQPLPPPAGAAVELPWLSGPEEYGALFLRWRPADRAPFPALQWLLRPLAGLARKQEVELRFARLGGDWQLSLQGAGAPLPALLGEVIAALREPSADVCTQGRRLAQAELRRQAADLPIRRLLGLLPEYLAMSELPSEPAEAVSPERIRAGWAESHWDGLLLGLGAEQRVEVGQWLSALPGTPCPDGLPLPALAEGRYRRDLPMGGEQAVLLFLPLADRSARGEAAARLLARCLEEPFYRRLRSELQLGYAVFSGFRQVAGWPGLLFAVQSPWASLEQLVGHIETFLHEVRLPQGEALETLRQALPAALEVPARLAERAAQAWQLHLAGRPLDWPERLRAALAELRHADLRAVHQALLSQAGGRWLLTAV
ncbi:pyrroloquinoline quinone biosynthesis protein PqqF [Zestomonas thermotolerans]|uniref:pyrroloquinoline quinone biosynthesis protein PqqF n=1 Tax=Zestomonas thermotolerans TaxID=157784 RepID=UPI0023EFEE5A|nr:pyrroloquinoline quinone biosynthesis protein PqqF [Pseudomonas thermotolerans]